MQKIRDIINVIEKFAPPSLQCDFDNSGLMYGDIDKNIEAVLVSLDTNSDIVAEAVRNGCGMIIEHHPIIFHPIKRIDINHPKHIALCEAVKNGIAIYSAHTNIDFAAGGLNDFFAQKLGCEEIRTVDGTPYAARIGKLKQTFTLSSYANWVALKLGDTNVSTVGDPDMQVRTIAVANGAGGGSEEALLQAKEAGADIFITSELKYNVVRLAKDINYGIISVGHYDSETCFTELICGLLSRSNLEIKVCCAQSLKNPYNDRRHL